ncbi:tripartite tricarboxylate transporter TctB family protein [Halomarina halobia]|uniref:Tripartite tricarboxylate transporter TctB family protein n=1 Tax=Halomarina halobia TaxID=3033386 RepID=A0ABD6ADH1_9EURY|nr:tripartite tricarboxylate transporter TctB family protein [Halomarina sp. PSR21]
MKTNLSRFRTVSVGVSGRTITIHPGELLLPLLVLLFVGVYYVGTRGLPDQSMMYAGPLMYITLALAVVTLLQHGFSIDGDERTVEDYRREHEARKTTDAADTRSEEGNRRYFNRRSAIGLVILTLGYILTMATFGFILSTSVFLGVLLFLFGERRPLVLVAYSVGFALLVWGVFIYWLKVPL